MATVVGGTVGAVVGGWVGRVVGGSVGRVVGGGVGAAVELLGTVTGFAVVGTVVLDTGGTVVGFAVVGAAVVGLAAVGLAVVGAAVVGFVVAAGGFVVALPKIACAVMVFRLERRALAEATASVVINCAPLAAICFIIFRSVAVQRLQVTPWACR